MTANQTIDGVPREMLQRFAKYLDDGLHLSREEREILDELRALLDAPVECRCKRYGKSNPHWPCPVHTESAQEQALDELRALLDAARCDSCDDSGDLIDLTGEWRGYCVCPIGVALKNKPAAQPRGEPVAWVVFDNGFIDDHTVVKTVADEWAERGFEVTPLYAEQPTPAAPPLPERKENHDSGPTLRKIQADGWNACLDELKRLNPSM